MRGLVDTTKVTASGTNLVLPRELWEAVHRTSWLKVVPEREGAFYFVAAGLAEKAKAACKRLLKVGGAAAWYRLTQVDSAGSHFTLRPGAQVPHPTHSYRIINYGRSIYLIPADAVADGSSRERAWANLEGYHEHMRLAQQDANATRCSQWLARVCAGFRPESILELGCGSGRNLHYLRLANPDARLWGIDVNPGSIQVARSQLDASIEVSVGSLYDLSAWHGVDVVVTAGVLMHVPTELLEQVIRECHRIAKIAVVNFELHSPSHAFDYHRYPRDYKKVYDGYGLDTDLSYRVFPRFDYRSRGTKSFWHALLVSRKRRAASVTAN